MSNAPKPDNTETATGTNSGGQGDTNNGGNGNGGTGGNTQDPKPQGTTFTAEQQAEINRLLAAEKRATESRVKTELTAAQEREKAEKQGEFERLYNEAKSQIAALESQLADVRLERTREIVGRKHNIPDALIPRLVGKDETEIDADAKKVRKELDSLTQGNKGGGSYVGTPGGGNNANGGTADAETTAQEKRKLRRNGGYSL